jgi:hypothetical protein
VWVLELGLERMREAFDLGVIVSECWKGWRVDASRDIVDVECV